MRVLLAAVSILSMLVTGALGAERTWPGQCVADRQEMRRNHMDLLMHTRDATVRQGVRPAGRGLDGCVTCHAVKDERGVPVTVADERHFCNSCHISAAVRIDCFSCHSSLPGGAR
ncbi:MAG TPA: Hdr-like menaquinol oxidoreductase cytochrome c subunit [Azospirillum sp.]|nr:Hdr-like menaquinol oxidoreductase cytochrome c subunit [Azospirillum sp.]